MILILWILIFVVAIYCLVKSADYFTHSSERIGLYFGMPAFLVGVTIVGLGTSLPELITSIVAVAQKSPEIVLGNVVGSNIANILLIIGIVAVVNCKAVFKKPARIDLPFLGVATGLLLVFSLNRIIGFAEALILFSLYILYIVMTVFSNRDNKRPNVRLDWKDPFFLLVSAAVIYFSAEYVVKSIIVISELVGFGKEVIAASAVALGTSLPELSVSFMAAKNGNIELSIGNILGSNIFNTFVVLGIPGMIAALPVTGTMLTLSIPVMFLATVMFFYIIKSQRLKRWQGIVMLALYALFILGLFGAF